MQVDPATHRAAYCLYFAGNRWSAASLGLGVYERGWIGIFSMATHPTYRRRGAATAVLRALADWGQSLGAKDAYLQVMESNITARRLYENIGFKNLYQYYYREGS
ncbi:MAG: GNAT family N-acetyltransferase [Chloroflexi bacterium]|nr:GNAT family N-acetyltransferase [Chloroflexota bacterium]